MQGSTQAVLQDALGSTTRLNLAAARVHLSSQQLLASLSAAHAADEETTGVVKQAVDVYYSMKRERDTVAAALVSMVICSTHNCIHTASCVSTWKYGYVWMLMLTLSQPALTAHPHTHAGLWLLIDKG